jgi:outer membrane protein OmpA-like peptidoglycan-associated protein
MVGQTKSGAIVEKESNMHTVLDAKLEEGIRYSIIYEFNKSKAISIYEKYLTDVITKIPVGASVIIHGHTDDIGEEVHNQDLSFARANDVNMRIVYLKQEEQTLNLSWMDLERM